MTQSITFDNPKDFVEHLTARIQKADELSSVEARQLLEGSVTALEQVLSANRVYTERLVQAVDCLNTAHPTWGHALARLYEIFECGQVTPEEMNEILRQEVN